MIGREVRAQCNAKLGKLPDIVLACVGGGSNAMGIFTEFVNEPSVRLIGVEVGRGGCGWVGLWGAAMAGLMGRGQGAAAIRLVSGGDRLHPRFCGHLRLE